MKDKNKVITTILITEFRLVDIRGNNTRHQKCTNNKKD